MNGYEPPNIDARPSPDCRFVKSLAELDGLADPAIFATPTTEPPPKGKTPGRWKTLNSFVDFTLRNLTRAEGFVWLVLYRETKPDGTATASVGWLAEQIGANRSTVVRAIKRLKAVGLLAVVRRGSLRRGPSQYRVIPLAKRAGKGAK